MHWMSVLTKMIPVDDRKVFENLFGFPELARMIFDCMSDKRVWQDSSVARLLRALQLALKC